MLQQLMAAATGGTLKISHVYLGHIKKDEDRKILAHAEALEWEQVEPTVRTVLESYLYQAIDGPLGQANFPSQYVGQVLPVAKVASEDFDRTRNQPTVEVMEAIRDMTDVMGNLFIPQLIEFGNTIAYKVMAAGAVKNHLVAVLKFAIVPQLGAQPIQFVFATVVNLDDRQESLFDERAGKFITTDLHNVIKRSSCQVGAFYPCLGEDGKETADLLVYASSGAGAWFKALEMSPRLSPKKEGQALVRMIAEQTIGGDVRPDVFQVMYPYLRPQEGESPTLHVQKVIPALEKAVGHGIDRLGFQARWESAFGDLEYRPAFGALFGDSENVPADLKLQAGELTVKLTTMDLAFVRQVKVGDLTFLVAQLWEPVKVAIGKDLDMRLTTMDIDEFRTWLYRAI